MTGYWTLMRLTLLRFRAAFRSGNLRKADGKLNIGGLVIMVMVTLGFAVLAGMAVYAETALFGILSKMGHALLLPAMTLLLCMATALLLGLFSVMPTLYMPKDSEWFASMPVSPRAVLLMRLTELWMSELLIGAALFLPAAIMYGIHIAAGPVYYAVAVLTMMLAPLLPLSINAVIATVLARFSSGTKNREAWIYASSILVAVVVVAAEMTILPKIPDDADAMFFVTLLLNNEALINTLLHAVPPVRWAVLGLSGNPAQWLLFAVTVLAAATLVVWLLGRSYMGLCTRQLEQGSRRRIRVRTEKDWKVASPVITLAWREWHELIKTPIYAMNTFAGAVFMPLGMIVGVGYSAASEMSLPLVLEGLRSAIATVPVIDLVLVLTAILSLPTFMNPAAATSVSREGQRLYISRCIPVPYRTQLAAKALVSMGINLILSLSLLVLTSVLLGQRWYLTLPALLLSGCISYASTAVALTVEAIRPQLSWRNETQAMKQNFNFAISMLVSLLLIALPAVAVIFLGKTANARLALALACLLAETVAGAVLMKKVAPVRYASLEA